MKQALILHGWPQYRIDRYFLSSHLRKKGANVIMPNMFSRDYIFSPANVLNDALTRLNGKKLDVIVGISLGGLIAPHIMRHFSDANKAYPESAEGLESIL